MKKTSIPDGMWDRSDVEPLLAAGDLAGLYQMLQREGFTQRGIGRLAGQNQTQVWEILSGRRCETRPAVVGRIADNLGIPRSKMGLPPPATSQIPDGIWDRPHVAPILERRDIGAIFQLLVDAGLPPERIAQLTVLRTSEVKEIMDGRRRVASRKVRRRVAAGLGIAHASMAEQPTDELSVPHGFWDRPDVAPLVAARDLGGLYRALHQAGRPQRTIAKLVGCAQSLVSGFIRGKRFETRPEVLGRIADRLGIDRTRMGLDGAHPQRRGREGSPVPGPERFSRR
jgi:hypothetical protein